MDINYYCYNKDSKKNYCQIFTKNYVLGWQIASNSVISKTITPFSMVSNPYLNRAIELAMNHLIQESYMPTTPTNYNELYKNFNSTNFIVSSGYRGLVQTNKYIPNLWTQSIFKESLIGFGKNLPQNMETLIKGSIAPTFGMSLFFTIGAFENKITEPTNKLYFTGALYTAVATIASQSCITEKSHIDKASGSILLTIQDTALVSAGLISSFVIFEIVKITYNSAINDSTNIIGKYISYTYSIYNETLAEFSPTTKLTVTTAVIIATDLYLGNINVAIANTATMIAFPLAKAIGGTFVEIAEDYSDTAIMIALSASKSIGTFVETVKNYADFSGLFSINDFDFI